MSVRLSPDPGPDALESALARLPAPPASVLVIGARGALPLERLRDAGYAAEGAAAAGQAFDAALVLGIDGALDPLSLLCRARAALGAHGTLLLAAGPGGTLERCGPVLDALGPLCGLRPQSLFLGAGLMAFRSVQPPGWGLSRARPEDSPEIRAVFEKVFGHPMSAALWDWKYGQGRGAATVARREGRIVAHYGLAHRRILFRGRPAMGAVAGDVMVLPGARGGGRGGAFSAMARANMDLALRWPGGLRIFFGFPHERHMRLGEALRLYSRADGLVSLHWATGPARRRLGTRLEPVDPAGGRARAVESLWERMRRELADSVLVVRDWAYMRDRYFLHPEKRYCVLLVSSRWTARPLGAMVLGAAGPELELVDFVGPPSALAAVVDQARRMAAKLGLGGLRASVNAGHAGFFSASGARAVPVLTNAVAVANGGDAVPLENVRSRLWLMPGDADDR